MHTNSKWSPIQYLNRPFLERRAFGCVHSLRIKQVGMFACGRTGLLISLSSCAMKTATPLFERCILSLLLYSDKSSGSICDDMSIHLPPSSLTIAWNKLLNSSTCPHSASRQCSTEVNITCNQQNDIHYRLCTDLIWLSIIIMTFHDFFFFYTRVDQLMVMEMDGWHWVKSSKRGSPSSTKEL